MITFDGHDLESIAIVGPPNITSADFSADLSEVPARDGSIIRGTRLRSPSISMPIAIVGTDYERRRKLSMLISWLKVDGPRRLVIPDDESVYWMAVPSGTLDMARRTNRETATLTFVLAEPAAYGSEMSATIPSGGSVEIEVGGTYPTAPIINGTVTRSASSLVWGVRLDDEDFIHIETGANAGRVVAIDCVERACTVSGNAKLPTLDSDWLVLFPGHHVLENDQGTGEATVRWIERWL